MFKSNEELFQTTNELISAFEKSRNSRGAEELRTGMRAVNGLTDGWPIFLESIQKVQKQYSSQLNSSQQSTLKNIYQAVYEAVYRRSTKPWWRFW